MIGQIHAELEEAATELGFEGLQQALEAGCEVEWHKDSAELLEPLEAAHRAFEADRKLLLEELDAAKTYFNEVQDSYVDEQDMEGQYILAQLEKYMEHAIKFVKETHE